MKKLLLVILIIALSLSLFGCGECETHIDNDGNGACDECGSEVSVEPQQPENPENPENPEIPEEQAPSEIETPKVNF